MKFHSIEVKFLVQQTMFQLHQDLLTPVNEKNYSYLPSTSTIIMNLKILQIDLNDINSRFSVYGDLSVVKYQNPFDANIWTLKFNEIKLIVIFKEWLDEKLQWDSADYSEISEIYFEQDEIWKPQISFVNCITTNDEVFSDTEIFVRKNGKAIWRPSVHIQVYCPIDFYYWPFDEHTCSLHFSISNDNENYLLEWGIDSDKLNFIIENEEWEIKNVEMDQKHLATKNSTEMASDLLFYRMTIKRKPSFYRAVVTFPAIVVILLVIGAFWIPPQLTQRIFLYGIEILLINLFLIHFAKKVASNTSLIGISQDLPNSAKILYL